MFKALLTFVAALAFALSPLVVTGFAGFDPNLFPVPQVDPPVQPAGYAFSIWGLIYLWLLLGTGFGLARRATAGTWQSYRAPLILSLVIGIFWLPAAMRSPVLATVMIWAMLLAALASLRATGRADRWLQQAPVAIYAGWLTAASSVSIGLMLAGYGLMNATPAALVALALALVLAVQVQLRLRRAPEYGLSVIWALIAVIVANAAPLNMAVAGLAALGVVAVVVAIAATTLRHAR